MHVSQSTWSRHAGWGHPAQADTQANWVLVFGSPACLDDSALLGELRARHPGACITGCSTAGEICGTDVHDDTLVATAVRFEHTRLRCAEATVDKPQDSQQAAALLAAELDRPGLVHVLVLSDGLHVNGTALAAGLRELLPAHVAVTGGLAGDGGRFQRTLVCTADGARENRVAAVGFYGDRLRVGFGSLGGWDSFGPERLITRSDGSVLYELDGRPALELYKHYLGEHAAGLPASALLFPLSLRGEHPQDGLVRTVLGIDEASGSMTFAGDVPQGSYARLMKANFDRLIEGAGGAARASLQCLGDFQPELAVLISCVGRKLVLKQRVEEEVESVRDMLGAQAVLTGFYSYGEICPHGAVTKCELHNQTMTITTFSEQ